jgi:hypothetical protein
MLCLLRLMLWPLLLLICLLLLIRLLLLVSPCLLLVSLYPHLLIPSLHLLILCFLRLMLWPLLLLICLLLPLILSFRYLHLLMMCLLLLRCLLALSRWLLLLPRSPHVPYLREPLVPLCESLILPVLCTGALLGHLVLRLRVPWCPLRQPIFLFPHPTLQSKPSWGRMSLLPCSSSYVTLQRSRQRIPCSVRRSQPYVLPPLPHLAPRPQ